MSADRRTNGTPLVEVGMDESTLAEIVRDMLPKGKYHGIKPIETPGTSRANFQGMWGRNGGARPVRIKVDKAVDSARKNRRRADGYDTANDATVLSHMPYDDVIEQGISPILDYEEADGVVVTVEPEFTEGLPLDKFFRWRKPSRQEFNQVVSGITRAVRCGHSYGFYHRDLNSNNLMARKRGNGLETRVTDWELAVPKESVQDAPFNTSGTRSLRDPLLETRSYGDQSEIYQIAMNAISLFSREALSWNNDLELKDPAKRKEAVRKAIGQMPKDIRKRHGKWIERSLSLDEKERFESFGEFADAISYACRPGFWERVKSHGKAIGIAGLTTAVLATGLGGAIYGHSEKVHAERIYEASMPRVVASWNGRGIEQFNKQIEFDVSLSGYVGQDRDHFQWYPERNKFLRVVPGQNLEFVAKASSHIEREGSKSAAWLNVGGQFYIEGERFDDGKAVKTFNVATEDSDEGKRVYDEHYYNPSQQTFQVPSHLKEGVYVFVAEFYAPTEGERTREFIEKNEHYSISNGWHDAKIRFEEPGKGIARKRIPLVVGNPEQISEVYNIGFNWPMTSWYARKLEDSGLSCGEILAPREGIKFYTAGGDQKDLEEDLPRSNRDGETREGYFCTRDSQGRIIGFTGVPLKSRAVFDETAVAKGYTRQDYFWDFGSIDRGFAERLVQYKESLPEVEMLTKGERK